MSRRFTDRPIYPSRSNHSSRPRPAGRRLLSRSWSYTLCPCWTFGVSRGGTDVFRVEDSTINHHVVSEAR
jgi:hypothetical protein